MNWWKTEWVSEVQRKEGTTEGSSQQESKNRKEKKELVHGTQQLLEALLDCPLGLGRRPETL